MRNMRRANGTVVVASANNMTNLQVSSKEIIISSNYNYGTNTGRRYKKFACISRTKEIDAVFRSVFIDVYKNRYCESYKTSLKNVIAITSQNDMLVREKDCILKVKYSAVTESYIISLYFVVDKTNFVEYIAFALPIAVFGKHQRSKYAELCLKLDK